MHKPGVQKFGKRVLQIGLPVIILALFVYQVKKNWADLTVYTFQLNPWLLALAFLGFMLQEFSSSQLASCSGKTSERLARCCVGRCWIFSVSQALSPCL